MATWSSAASRANSPSATENRRMSFQGSAEELQGIISQHVRRPGNIIYPEVMSAKMDRSLLEPHQALWRALFLIQPNLSFPKSTMSSALRLYVEKERLFKRKQHLVEPFVSQASTRLRVMGRHLNQAHVKQSKWVMQYLNIPPEEQADSQAQAASQAQGSQAQDAQPPEALAGAQPPEAEVHEQPGVIYVADDAPDPDAQGSQQQPLQALEAQQQPPPAQVDSQPGPEQQPLQAGEAQQQPPPAQVDAQPGPEPQPLQAGEAQQQPPPEQVDSQPGPEQQPLQAGEAQQQPPPESQDEIGESTDEEATSAGGHGQPLQPDDPAERDTQARLLT